MAKRGPKPKPTHLKLVKGITRKDRVNLAEPIVPLSIPSAPAHLSDVAKVEWGRVTERLFIAGIITEIDRSSLAAYCQAYARWVQAEEAIARMGAADLLTGGLMIRTTGGNAIQNPLIGTANKAMSDMVRYAAEFGMTPSARSRIAAAKGENSDPAEKYFS